MLNENLDTEKIETSVFYRLKQCFRDIEVRTEIFEILLKLIKTPNNLLKVYLAIFVLVSSGLAAYTVIMSFIGYFSYEVITTSRTINETPTLFPKITICNVNPVISLYGVDLLKKANSMVSSNIDIFNSTQMKLIDKDTKRVLYGNISLVFAALIQAENFTNEQKKLLSHSFKDTIIECQFNYKVCSDSDFKWVFDPNYGNCYVYNSGMTSSGDHVDLKESSVTGRLFGLHIKFYVNYNEDLKEFNSLYGGKGVLIRVDNSSYLTGYNFDGIRVSPGFQTDISIERSFKFILPKPYSDCEIDESSSKTINSELYDLIAKSQYQYTQQLCLEQCFQKFVLKQCNCVASAFISLFDANICQDLNGVICYLNVFNDNYLSKNFIRDNCLGLCPLECNVTQYKTSLTAHQFQGNIYTEYIKNNRNLSSDFLNKEINSDTVGYSIASLYIFYGSLSYTISNESPKMDFVSLLANIGGNLGLFLGLSMLSLCEIIELTIEIVLKFTKK